MQQVAFVASIYPQIGHMETTAKEGVKEKGKNAAGPTITAHVRGSDMQANIFYAVRHLLCSEPYK